MSDRPADLAKSFVPSVLSPSLGASRSVNQAISASMLLQLLEALRSTSSCPVEPNSVAAAIAEACRLWSDTQYDRRRRVIEAVCEKWGVSVQVLDESLGALLKPFEPAALRSLAAKAPKARLLLGIIAPGNVVGAGLHEIVQGLVAGASLAVKTSSSEPFFFPQFVRTVVELEPSLGKKIAVLNWGREQRGLTETLLRTCNTVAAFGEDTTIEALVSAPDLLPFGTRFSGALIALGDSYELRAHRLEALARALARDVVLFEQRGCLSPHHVFVQSRNEQEARDFASLLARMLDELQQSLPAPKRFDLDGAAAVRAIREETRWRKLGGEPVELWEGASFAYTVVFDRDSAFRISPQHRTVYVSFLPEISQLDVRLAHVAGRLEAFALWVPESLSEKVKSKLRAHGVSYFCEPGQMQSPPVEWPHGGGQLLKRLGYSP